MEIEVLKKKISTFKSPSGRVGKLSDELLYEVLTAWENWTGSRMSFYSSIGVSPKGFASIIGKAKRLKREGYFPAEEFKEVQLSEAATPRPRLISDGTGILLHWGNKQFIKFYDVSQLVEFLRAMGDVTCIGSEKKAS